MKNKKSPILLKIEGSISKFIKVIKILLILCVNSRYGDRSGPFEKFLTSVLY